MTATPFGEELPDDSVTDTVAQALFKLSTDVHLVLAVQPAVAPLLSDAIARFGDGLLSYATNGQRKAP